MLRKLLSIFSTAKATWYEPGDASPQAQCPCCDYFSLAERGRHLICPLCFWEDDGQDVDALDYASAANHGITLREARQNFLAFGACELKMKPHVLPEAERSQFEYQARAL